jgi:hypothetical protein
MKKIIIILVFLSLSIHGYTQSTESNSKHEPNSGYVADASTAKEIAKTVMSHLLKPDDLLRKRFSDAVLKDGIWTVKYSEPNIRINFPVVIQIRQQTGGIISYSDPNA